MTRRGSNPSDSRRYLDWINASYDDYRAAQLLSTDPTLHNATAFHCQQCVEKALKGFILARSRQTVDGHNLTWLCRRAASIDAHFQQWMDESAALNRYYIETRYPTDIPTQISDEELSRILAMTEELFFYLSDALDVTGILDYLEAY